MPALQPADLDAILTRGGAARIALLRYSVMSVTLDPLFIFLAGEFRNRPSPGAALALYEVFCAPGAPARLDAASLLPPRELRLAAAAQRLRSAGPPGPMPQEGEARSAAAPMRGLFDFLVKGLREDPEGRLAALSHTYDPALDPEENLPDGRMNAGQRRFVDGVWRPVARPRLVAAGFWQLSSIE